MLYAISTLRQVLDHRLLHYGIEVEQANVLDKIYYDRSERLAASGIKISKLDFERLVV